MTDLSLASMLAEPARRRPDHIAVVQDGTRVTYRELYGQVLALAGDLVENGIRPGDRIALLAPNVIGFIRAYYAIVTAGAVVVPVPTLLTASEAAHLVSSSAVRLLIFDPEYRDVAQGVQELTSVTIRETGRACAASALSGFVTQDAEDPAVIFYTSGTTGKPKGAVLSHLNLVLNATVNALDTAEIDRQDIVLGCLPLFHTFGQTVAMNATFRMGATLVLQPRFDAEAALDLMDDEHVTLFLGVPTMYGRLLSEAAHRTRLPSPARCISGGAPLPLTVLEGFERVFKTTVYEGYGLSETSPTATMNQPVFGTRAGTVGHPVWGVDVEIAASDVDDSVRLLPTGELGEIVIRGHNVFTGYLDDRDATERAVVDGWFRTGDLGTKDEDGFITIVDRKKDLIIRNGFNAYPREIEEVLLRHDAVGQAAVVGLPDENVGEEICAVLVPRQGGTIEPDEVIAWARERLAKHKYPRRVEIVSELPLGPSHKILKRELRARLTEGPPRRQAPSPRDKGHTAER